MEKRKRVKNFVSKHELVILEWEDISTDVGWNGELEQLAAKPAQCVAAGFLVDINDQAVILCSGYADDGDLMDITSYPKGTVQKITYLNKVKVEKDEKKKTIEVGSSKRTHHRILGRAGRHISM